MSSKLIVASFVTEADKENFLKDLKALCKENDGISLNMLSKRVSYDHGIIKSSYLYDFKSRLSYYPVDREKESIEYEEIPDTSIIVFPVPIDSAAPYPVKNYKVKLTKEPATRSDILDEVKQIICHDRNDQYGGPEQSFEVIGAFFSTYLQYKKGIAIDISGEDVAMMMALFKIARQCTGKEKLDNWLDAIGYLACGAELSTSIKEEK